MILSFLRFFFHRTVPQPRALGEKNPENASKFQISRKSFTPNSKSQNIRQEFDILVKGVILTF